MTSAGLRRSIYLLAAATVCIGGASGLVGFFLILGAFKGVPAWFWIAASVPLLLALATFVGLIWLFLYLARKPRAWGKLVCLVGFPWIMFSTNAWLMSSWGGGFHFTPLLSVPGVAGIVLLCLAVTLLVVDRGAILTYRPG
jgi:hypothetical protein